MKTFNPERFLSERAKLSVGWGSSSNSEQSNEGNLLSFGVGPRQCVGLKLAKMVLIISLSIHQKSNSSLTGTFDVCCKSVLELYIQTRRKD